MKIYNYNVLWKSPNHTYKIIDFDHDQIFTFALKGIA